MAESGGFEPSGGTELFYAALAYDAARSDRDGLMREVWGGTPWMVDAYDGPDHEPRRREMLEWCLERFGPEAWPLHGRPGRWHRGGATINGWTWFGFDTEEALAEFEAAWPAPDGVAR